MWGRSIGNVWVEEGRERLAGCLQRGVSFLGVKKVILLKAEKVILLKAEKVILLGVKKATLWKENCAPPLKTKKTTLWKEKTTAHP